MKILNLTPHEINEVESGKAFKPSGVVARVSVTFIKVQEFGGIPIFVPQYGEVKDLRDQEEDTMLIVSAMVRLAMPQRDDLVSPGELVRNGAGQPIGCRGFVWNQ
jgi:hypothetical protein